MRRGSVFRRCGTCRRRVDGSVCNCGSRSVAWYFSVDVAPPGAERCQVMRGGFATKAAAVTAMNDLQDAHRSGSVVEPSQMTVAEMFAEWLEHVGPGAIRESTWQNRRVYVEHYVSPYIGHVAVQRLTRRDLDGLYRRLGTSGAVRGGGGLAPSSVHSVHLVIHAALKWAVERQLVPRNVADSAHRLSDAGDPEAWSEDELTRFLQAARDDELFALWQLLAMSGLRLGEALGLRWREVDFRRNLVVVRRNRSKGADGEIRTGVPKTRRGRRTVDLDPTTMATLGRPRARRTDVSPDDLVFVVPRTGKALHPDAVRSRFYRLVRLAGVPRLTPHGLRDTHATLLLQQGEPLHVVSRRLGHANEAFTARRYAAVLPGQQAGAVTRLAARLQAARSDGSNERHA